MTILESYRNNKSIMAALNLAAKQEQEMADGWQASQDIVIHQVLDQETGMWRLSFKVPHGEVMFIALDHECSKLRIVSTPSAEMVIGRESMRDDEIMLKQYKNSRSMSFDMRDITSLKAAKEYFANDYVMSNIPLADPKAGNVARMLIWYLRKYRSAFLDFYKTFSFLWKDTPYTGALALRKAMCKQ